MDRKKIAENITSIIKKPWFKYVVAIVIFFVLILSLKDYNIFQYRKLKKQRTELEQRKAMYEEEIKQDSINTYKLQKDIHAMEKFGREKYLMKKENEDIFRIIQSSEEIKAIYKKLFLAFRKMY